MSIDTFLARHGAKTAPRPKRSAAERVLAEIAAQAVVSRDAEQLLRAVERSLSNDADSLCIRLEESPAAASPVSVVARRLTNIGILTVVRKIVGDEPSLVATISKRCSERVRDQVSWLVQNGRWLELGAAELVREVAEAAGQQVEVATRVQVTLSDGTLREVDVFACAGGEALLIECKSGYLGIDGVGRYGELAESLGISRARTLVLALTLDAQAASDVKAFYPVTVVPREHLKNIVAQRLATMVATVEIEQLASQPKPTVKKAAKKVAAKPKPGVKKAAKKVADKPKPGVKKAAKKVADKPKPAVKKMASKKAAAQPKAAATKAATKKAAAQPKAAATKAATKKPAPPLPRKVVAPDLIESVLISAAEAASPPANLGALANRVREELWCTSSAAKTAARRLLDGQRFLNRRNEVVGDFSTPIHAVQAADPNSTQPS